MAVSLCRHRLSVAYSAALVPTGLGLSYEPLSYGEPLVVSSRSDLDTPELYPGAGQFDWLSMADASDVTSRAPARTVNIAKNFIPDMFCSFFFQ